MSFKQAITRIQYNKEKNPPLILRFCSRFYDFGSSVRNFFYDTKLFAIKKVSARVISVGNLTTGGVGKTPIVQKIAEHLNDKGEKVVIISRGYGGKLSNGNVNLISDGKKIFYNAKSAGDEAFWLAKSTEAVVITCKDRVKAANFATEKFAPTTIILDDGFQHRRIHRDLNLVLVDSQKVFGNGYVLPAGPLRETKKNIKRADKILIISKSFDHTEAYELAELLRARYRKPTSVCKIEPDKIYNIKTNEFLKEGARVNAMSAIGQPEQFYQFVEMLYDVKAKFSFNDHHIYREKDLAKIKGKIVTTEKDAVKLSEFERNDIYALKLKTDFDVEALLND